MIWRQASALGACALAVLFVLPAGCLAAHAQSGGALDTWSFEDTTNWTSDLGYRPASFTNLTNSNFGDGQAVVLDSPSPAWLRYNVVEDNGHTNLTLNSGSILFWFAPDWADVNDGGSGPGAWAPLIQVGEWTTNASFGFWGLYVDPNGTNLYFLGQTNDGGQAVYLSAPLAWTTWLWHQIALTYSATNSSLYLDGVLVTNGAGVSYLPGPEAVAQGLFIGSDTNGILQAHGILDDLSTYDFQLDSNAIAWAFASHWIPFYGNPDDPANWISTFSGGFAPMDAGFRPPPGGFGGSGGQFDFGTNLWLWITSVSNDVASVALMNTMADELYEIQSTTNLAQVAENGWVSEGSVEGSEVTNWTSATVSTAGRPTLFLRVRSWVDSQGTGIPDWWWYKYVGSIGDSYALDPSGDGWTYLQDYQNGWLPDVYQIPPAPGGLSVRYNVQTQIATVTWNPSPGTVSSYTLQRNDPLSGITNTVPLTVNLYDDSVGLTENLTPDPVSYRVRANYGSSNSAWSAWVPLYPYDPSGSAEFVRGAQGLSYLVVGGTPQNAATVRALWTDFTVSNVWIAPVSSFTNGVAMVPTNWLPADWIEDQGEVFLEYADNSTNLLGVIGAYFGPNFGGPPFYDGRQQLQQNLAFVLRAATAAIPFGFYPEGSIPLWYSPDPMVSTTNYAFAGIYDILDPYGYLDPIDEFLPFKENSLYRNFVFSTNTVDDSGDFTTGAGADGYENVLEFLPSYLFPVPGPTNYPPANGLSVTPLLPPSETRWLWWGPLDLDPLGMGEIGIFGSYTMAVGATNLFGLPFLSAEVAYNTNGVERYTELDAGYSFSQGDHFYPETKQPGLRTVGYNFFRSGLDFLPGDTEFSPTNPSPLLITGLGTSFSANWGGYLSEVSMVGYAKQTITNGDTTKPAYLGQYFDAAYLMDTNGLATTNQTGILSPYGDFFPTQPGPTALVTLPNYGDGARGTATVYVVSLALDANHDGTMDTSWGGPDTTTPTRPFVFWLNNNYDRNTLDINDGTNYDDDVASNSVAAQNYSWNPVPDSDYTGGGGNRIISCVRDLQDFARLWVCGITTNLLTNLPAGTTITLSWGDIGNPNPANPTIDLFKAADPDGGIGYLTNSTIAASQADPTGGLYVKRLGPGGSVTFLPPAFSNPGGVYFIWCGVSNGAGALNLTISQGGTNTLAQTMAYIKIMDIKQMYERWTVGDDPTLPPKTNAAPAEEDLPPGMSFQYPPSTDTNTPYILFVHGWNMERWEKDRFAESAFKRLYWQGYQGRFGSFRWPTENQFIGTWTEMLSNPSEKDNFDRSEYTAWRSSTGLLNKLNNLNAEYPGHVYLLAHSMGNIVANEALRLAGSSRVVNTYTASQAAVSAHTYYTNIPNYSFTFSGIGFGPKTPNIYGNWFAGNSGGGAGTVVNFYNTNDYALQRSVWQVNQLLKPDVLVLENGSVWTYAYTGSASDPPPWTNFLKALSFGITAVHFDIANVLSNRYEVMALAAQSYTTALGATPGVLNLNRSVLLTRTSPSPIWPADPSGDNYSDHFWHSAEFRGDYWQQQGYWGELLGPEAFNLK